MSLDFSKANNSHKLQEVVKNDINNNNRIVAINIPLDEIDKNEDNEKIFNMSDIEYLAKGIEDEGFFGAIEVYKKPNGRYEISSGHRRYEAMKYLHRETIPCIVKDVPDDLTRAKKLLSSNMRNRKLTPLDMARAIDYYNKMLKKEGIKGDFKKQASEFFNISAIQVYRFQCILKLIPELQEMANSDEFPYSAFREAVALNKEGQYELYSQLKEIPTDNITRVRIEHIIENIRDNKEYQSRPNIERKKETTNKAKDVSVKEKEDIDYLSITKKYIESFKDMNTMDKLVKDNIIYELEKFINLLKKN